MFGAPPLQEGLTTDPLTAGMPAPPGNPEFPVRGAKPERGPPACRGVHMRLHLPLSVGFSSPSPSCDGPFFLMIKSLLNQREVVVAATKYPRINIVAITRRRLLT